MRATHQLATQGPVKPFHRPGKIVGTIDILTGPGKFYQRWNYCVLLGAVKLKDMRVTLPGIS